MNESVLTIIVPARSSSGKLAFNAAGFIATSTCGASPGVSTFWLEKCTWNPLTPASVPAGARISAGKSGIVLMSFPNTADVFVNCVPVNCIPSPESPANRIATDSSSSDSCVPFPHSIRHMHSPSNCTR